MHRANAPRPVRDESWLRSNARACAQDSNQNIRKRGDCALVLVAVSVPELVSNDGALTTRNSEARPNDSVHPRRTRLLHIYASR
jgi:hypothetical protein